MLKITTVFVSALMMSMLLSCSKGNLAIEPISKELNERFMTGDRLNKSYFSTRDIMQYYQISNFSHIPPKRLLAELTTFTNAHYRLTRTDTVEKITILFYRKRLFVDYSDHLYESARDNENRTLEDYPNDLIAIITYEKLKKYPQKMVFSQFLRDAKTNDPPIQQTDTMALK